MKLNNKPKIILEPQITEQEIKKDEHSKSGHIGCSKNFNGLLTFMVNLGAFGNNVSASRVADLMYARSSRLEPTPAQEKAGKSGSDWGDRRFHRIRYGTGSFTKREANYFFDVFTRFFGKEWAQLITPAELILNPLSHTIKHIQERLLPSSWSNLNPVHALHILEASQTEESENRPSISIILADELRLSKQNAKEIEATDLKDEVQTLSAGTEYYLGIEGIDDDKQVLVLEYADQAIQLPEYNKPIQAQRLRHGKYSTEQWVYSAKDEQPLDVVDHPGKFGFCVITFPESWDEKEAFGLSGKDWLSVAELHAFVTKIRGLSMHPPEIQMSLYDYQVLHK